MNALDLLKHTTTLGGLHAPTFTWIAAVLIPLFTFYFLLRLVLDVRHQSQQHKSLIRKMLNVQKGVVFGPKDGLSLSTYEALTRAFNAAPALKNAWRVFSGHMILRRNSHGEEQMWASQSSADVFSDSAILDPYVNHAFYSAVPGMTTGAGLLFTFLAILVALLDVRSEQSRVLGLELLIQGLSGKFLSSIAALSSATIYIFVEKKVFHKIARSRQTLTEMIDIVVPQISPTQILADLSRDISEQSTAFRSFNTDLSQKLKTSFSESMGPTLARMVSTIEELNQMLRAAEAQKQESITGSLDSLLNRLEISMSESLRQMSNGFRESISGSAMTEFQRVTESLGGTAALLEKMNAQSMLTQAALSELVQFAKSSASEQIEIGRNQVQDLTEVLRGLMVQMNETAGSSVNKMAATLTTVVHDLSNRVNELGDKMSDSILNSAGLATGAASEIISKADQWTTRSAEQLADLLEAHRSELGIVKDLRGALEESLVRFQQALSQYAAVSSNVDRMVSEANATVASISGAVKNIRETHEAVQRVAAFAAKQVESLSDGNREQQAVWGRIRSSMEEYEAMFGRVESNAGRLLDNIGQHLTNYIQVSQRGFEGLVKTSDEHFRNATTKLGTSVEQLDEVLQDLAEDLGKAAKGRANGGGR